MAGITIPIKTIADLKGLKSLASGFATAGLAIDGVKQSIGLLVAPFRAIVDASGKLADSWATLEQVQRKGIAALGSGFFTMQPQIEQLALATGRATDDLNTQLAQMAETAVDANNSFGLLNATLNLSVALGKSESTTAELIRNGVRGQTTELEKIMPLRKAELDTIKALRNPREREVALLHLLNEEYGGIAASVDPGLAAYKTLQNSLGDVVEEMGRALFTNPQVVATLQDLAGQARVVVAVTADLVTILGQGIATTVGLGDASKKTGQPLGSLTEAVGLLAEGISWLIAVVDIVSGLLESAFTLAVSAILEPLRVLIQTVALLSDAVGLDSDALDQMAIEAQVLSAGLDKDLDASLEKVTGSLSRNEERIKSINKTMADGIRTTDQYRNVFERMWDTATGPGSTRKPGRAPKRPTKAAPQLASLQETQQIKGVVDGLAISTSKWKDELQLSATAMQSIFFGFDAVDTRIHAVDKSFAMLGRTAGIAIKNLEPTVDYIGGATQAFESSFQSLVTNVIDGSTSMGDALLQMVLQWATMFGQFLLTSSGGLQALQSSAFGAAAAAGIALLALSAFLGSAFSGGGGGRAVSSGVAPIDRAREAQSAPAGDIIVVAPSHFMSKQAEADYVYRASEYAVNRLGRRR